ncbi:MULTISPECIES: helix-turn-helix domain-containing protein [Listeria]|uniref:helix-turn-helix domain-containing protein n=1 Tax=Listeria TaxID=1637 RepID=UPI000B5967B9|nr:MULTISPECIES: helix-turn-helix transcriptional regulator [Listeria]
MSHNIHNIHKTLYEIRILKRMSQAEVSGQIPLSTYRKIERGITTPTVPVFFTILENLDMSFTEFFFLHDRKDPASKENILFLYREIRHSLNPNALNNFQRVCQKYLQSNHDQDVQNLYTVSEAIKTFSINEDLQECYEIVQAMHHAISVKSHWFYWDALAIQGILHFLDSDDAIEMAIRIREVFTEYHELYPAKESKIRTLLNLCYCLKLNRDILSAKPYIEQALLECETTSDQSLYFDALFIKAQILLEEGLYTDARRTAHTSIKQLSTFNSKFAEDNEMEWNKLLKEKGIYRNQKDDI